MLTDIEIAQNNKKLPIRKIAEKLGIDRDEIDMYGNYKAKIPLATLDQFENKNDGKLILVTAINPTPAGEGKTTTTVGLGDALNRLGKQAMVALREPSLGPTMGIKGGAAGGGYAQIVPMEDINLHFTGDMHAITTANNALSAMIDNHIHHGNSLRIDSRRVTWKRVVDLNDRALRQVTVGLGGPLNGYPRQDGFDITVASEIMAILCLATDLEDMRERLGRIVIGDNLDREPVTVKDLGCQGALTLLLKDALAPNLVQSLEHTPAFVHGGPFANIAHGCSSVIATRAALKLADYVVTEAGFGADLGGEKFLDIKVPVLGKAPDAVVIVATIRSLKLHGGDAQADLEKGEDVAAVKAGLTNLAKHIESMQAYQLPVVVALNCFSQDTEAEIAAVVAGCAEYGVDCLPSTVWADGGQGGVALAQALVDLVENQQAADFMPLYKAEETSLVDKMNAIVETVYGGNRVALSKKAQGQVKAFEKNGWGQLPVCMAKTQYSLSDDATAVGRPQGFDIQVRELVPKIGAGFIVALTGNVLTMPGLPKQPAAMNMDVDSKGNIKGLF
ncbi:formate--tetrahydrofolate ligase [Aerococcus urinaehominis]|uniref:Formate--tetrahydrofolate ligase n=1 Tax=Aerococcus urinaehominis TaxID=128944 RepID=A0A0X8FJZ4_9LACT|nr:formate--tetrahydrofolate ligase [Aerococcus urinaehominis]AMB98702.1 formate--tetrahydrofolate ligase [Aerococcus urinaehominis]SDL99244.1 Formate-tetrahydrofolate ligase [Aerococcus urinaehominis]